VDAVRRLENADESPVENLSDAVAADGRVRRYLVEGEVKQSWSTDRRPVENSDGYAAGWQDRFHPDRDNLPLIHKNIISIARNEHNCVISCSL